MTQVFQWPLARPLDLNGLIQAGSKLYFFDAGTTTDRTVFQDAAKTVSHAQPVIADGMGEFPVIYMPGGTFKVELRTSADVVLHTIDNLDPGLASDGGALPIAEGGTGATTAAAARTNLATASQSEVTQISGDLAAVEAQITAVGGTLRALAGRERLLLTDLDQSFGLVLLKRQRVSNNTYSVQSSQIPLDTSLPQITEGDPFMNITFTPVRDDTIIRATARVYAGPVAGNNQTIAAMFRDGNIDAIEAAFFSGNTASDMSALVLSHEVQLTGETAISFAVRTGSDTGANYAQNGAAGTAFFSGALSSELLVEEYLDTSVLPP